ncbi:MAG: CHRD domain-containing protein [Candidatus Krumholzibacteriia bacterium]
MRRRVLLLFALLTGLTAQAWAQSVDLEIIDTEVVRRVGPTCLGISPLVRDSTCVTVTIRNNGPDSLVAPIPATSYTTNMDGNQAVPIAVTPASGSGTFTLAGDLLSFNISMSGLLGTETAAHIRGPALPGSTAEILFDLPLGSPKIGVVGPLSECDLSDLAVGLWYVNIETTSFPSGEIRGQIVPALPKFRASGRVRITVDIDEPSKPGAGGFGGLSAGTTRLGGCFTGSLAPGEIGTLQFTGYVPGRIGTHTATSSASPTGEVTDPNDTNDSLASQFIVHAGLSVPVFGLWGLTAAGALIGAAAVWSLRRRGRRRTQLDA